MILASELGPSARLVAFVLSTHMDRNGGSCFPSITTIQRETGYGARPFAARSTELERAGLDRAAPGRRDRPTRYAALVVAHRDYGSPAVGLD